jgi:tRNA-binding protein
VVSRLSSAHDTTDIEAMTITYEDFRKVEMRVGRVVRAEQFPKARKPAYRLWIDFGELGVRQSSAQITTHYEAAALVGRLVLAVTNFPPRQIADFMSEVLVLGVPDADGEVVLIRPDIEVEPGGRVF